MATNPTSIKDTEINGVRMTAKQADTARAFARARYDVVGSALGAIILRTRSGRAEIQVAEDGQVIPWNAL